MLDRGKETSNVGRIKPCRLGAVATMLSVACAGACIVPGPIAASERSPVGATDSMIAQATQLAAAREFAGAESLLVAVLVKSPEDPGALYELGMVQSWAGRYDESIATLRDLFKLQPENIGLRFQIARIASWKAGRTGKPADWRITARELEDYLRERPDDLDARKELGSTHIKLGRFEDATAVLDKVASIDPSDPETARLRAQARLEAGNQSDGIAVLESYLQGKPDGLISLRWTLAESYLRAGDRDLAAATYREILHIDPRHAGAWTALGRTLLWSGELQESKRCLDAAQRIDGDQPSVSIARGEWAEARADWRSATTEYRQAFRLDPRNPTALDGLTRTEWMARPVALRGRYFLSRPSIGADQERVATDLTLFSGRRVSVSADAGWRRFQEDGQLEVTREEQGLSVSIQPIPRSGIQARVWESSLTSGPDADQKRRWNSFALSWQPTSRLALRGDTWHAPVDEPLTTLDSNYNDRGVGGGLRYGPRWGLTGSASASTLRRHGSFPVGYWNDYYDRWIELAPALDRSRHRRIEMGVGWRIPRSQQLELSYRFRHSSVTSEVELPYWAPPEEGRHFASLSGWRTDRSGSWSRVGLEAQGTDDPDTWGGGGNVALGIRAWRHVELSVSGSYHLLGRETSWEGRQAEASLQIR